MKNKFLLLIVLLMIPFVFANSIQLYGGETKTIGSYDSTVLEKDCVQVFVIVNASKSIQFTSEGVREYSLENCGYHAGGSSVDNNKNFDLWVCDCTDGKFNLILSVLPNTINNYAFSLAFYNESLIETENEKENNEQVFTTTATVTGGGGGGSSSGICRTEWTCTEWSECDNLIQTRFCSYPPRFCKPNQPKPAEIQNCTIEEKSSEEPEEILILTTQPANSFGKITGAVIGALGTNGTIGVFIFIFCIIGTAIFLIFKKRGN